MQNELLNASVSSLPLIGPHYAQKLEKLGIITINDFLNYYPFRYDDLSQNTTISSLTDKQTVTLKGIIVSIANIRTRSGRTMQKAIFADETGKMDVVWFNQPFLVNAFKKNPDVSLSGTIQSYHGRLSFSSPQYEYLKPSLESTIYDLRSTIHTGRLVPIYHQTSGISSKWIRSRLNSTLKLFKDIPDYLPPSIIQTEKLIDLSSAINQIHFPTEAILLQKAIDRLKFDELFLLQLSAQLKKYLWQKKLVSHQIAVDETKLKSFINSLPFSLTPDQQTSLQDIINDLSEPTPMNRLLQGDVGSGKTVVAAAAIYLSYLNKLPSVFMAPTEVLAMQHFETLTKLLTPFGLTISVQTKSQKNIKKADVYIGTHALLYRQLPKEIGLVVIDEQHRFGVEQRSLLLNLKKTPNVLSMTATPIPRTVALTLYSDLDLSSISTMPQGRLPVKTYFTPESKRTKAYQWIEKKIKEENAQVFIVCPLIEDSESIKLDQVKAVQSHFSHLQTDIFPHLKLGLLHGRMKQIEKEAVLKDFKDRKLHVLVSTPVIEVGIDIPEATIMVIEAAERFGLSQLHQLRGRVGRSYTQSYCLLFSTLSYATKRLKAMETIHSGIKLSELDLKLRGPGDIYGTRQSGYIDLKIASLNDQSLIIKTHQHAKKLIQKDPELSNYPHLLNTLTSLLAKSAPPN